MTSRFVVVIFSVLAAQLTMSFSQTNNPDVDRWLEHVEIAPDFKAPASRAEWDHQRQEVRREAKQLLGRIPWKSKAPAVKILSSTNCPDYTVEKFEFDNGAGATVPGYCLIPKHASGKAPAILYCHWHGGQYDIGKEELFQAQHTPEPPGPALAKRGYVVLGIDAYCFGERNGRGPGGAEEKGNPGELSASKFNLWVGRTLWGMILHDDLMALEYLLSRPEVDKNRIGVMGMSMGATRAWWLMALDERIKAGVPICCMTRYQSIIKNDLLKAHGIYYYVPGLLNHFDTEAIIGLIAPRPILFLDGDSDRTSPLDGIRTIENAVRPVYDLYGRREAFESIVYPALGHLYTQDMWQKTLTWLDKNLKGD